uniref:Uncharacterized protein n=1 Tax=Ciona savignyi TaxID=51511 RepID=H2YH76_CIOSA
MPAKWATAFWISLIYHQARAGGLREQSRVHLEYKKPFFPRDYPECQSGANYWDAVMKEKKKVYYRKPPAKRANYHHLASPFPFAPCWQHIFDQDVKTKLSVTDLTQNTKILNECIKEQNKEINLVKIDKNDLDKMSTQKDESGVLKGAISGVKREAEDNSLVEPSKKIKLDDSNKFKINVIRSPETVSNLEKWLSEDPFSEKLDVLCDKNCFGLVCVRLTVMNKGTPTECSMLCVPSGDDLKILETQFKDLYGKGLANCLGPVEEPHPDPGKQE